MQKTLIPLFVLLISVLSVVPTRSYAATQADLERTKKDMATSRAHQQELTKQQQKLEAELKDLQTKLVSLAGELQKGEAELSDLEDQQRILDDQLAKKNDELQKQHKHLEALVNVALRFARVPPEAVVMMPGDMSETMQAASALQMAASSIRQEVQSLDQQMSELQSLKSTVSQHHEELVRKQETLTAQRAGLQAKLTKRQDLEKQLNGQAQAEVQKLEKLAKKADDLQSLLTSISGSSRSRFGTELTTDTAVSRTSTGAQRSFVSARGDINPPVAGKVVGLFGQADGHTTRKGILIQTRAGAQVTAPYDGQVVFSGPFLAYGQLVIIRHSEGFHTLLAGLAKIDVSVGQFLLEGEPIGAMGDDQDKLYVEIRNNNQPVDPALWIRGFNKKE